MRTTQSVAVVGVGAIGAMAMWRLAEAGYEVTGFEQHAPANSMAASAGETRMFRMAYWEGVEYSQLLGRSVELWEELEEKCGRKLLHQNGSITIAESKNAFLTSLKKNAEASGAKLRRLSRDEATSQFPQHKLLDNEELNIDTRGGVILPEAAVLGALNVAQQLGATYVNEQVLTIEDGLRGAAVTTASGVHHFDLAIVATGPWARTLIPETSNYLRPERVVSIWYPVAEPEQFSISNFPPSVRRGSGLNLSVFPSTDERTIKVNLHLPRTAVADPDHWDRRVENEYVQATTMAVRTVFNGVRPFPVRTESYVEGFVDDGHPLIGRRNHSPSIIAAVGFSGHGFKFSPAIGEALVEYVSSGTLPEHATHMDINRFN